MIYEKNRLLWLLLLVVAGAYGSAQPKKKVCVIGAGPAGLTSAKQLVEGLSNVEPIVFERGTDIGGQWKYSDSADFDEHGLPVNSGVYKYMRANGPKVFMTFPDYQEFYGEDRSYVKHEYVLEYLRNYTDRFNLRQYIKLDTLVEKVSLMYDNRWRLETRNLNNGKRELYRCNAVMVCSGHFFKTYSPVIPGLETFTGRVLHSHAYRRPEEFANLTVAILGASYSGLDIGIDVSNYAKKIYLSHRHAKITSELPNNVIQIPGVVAANGGDLILSDGSRVQADAFIICTGYLYYFPFLDQSAGITVTNGKYVHPLYKHHINVNYPNMAIIGIPQPAAAFLVSYFQVQNFVSLLQGKQKLPSREVMLKDSQLPPGTSVNKAHFMTGPEILDYCDNLRNAAGYQLLSKPFRKAAAIYFRELNTNPLHFKDNELLIRDDGRVDFIRTNNTSKV